MAIFNPVLFIALASMDEMEYLPQLISCIKKQTYKNFNLIVCVNQPNDWWEKEDKISICKNNQKSIKYLEGIKDLEITIIDKSSKGKGWTGKKHGVGWARKTIMDKIAEIANKNDIIISLDADTTFNGNYFLSIVENFNRNPDATALSVPYYHRLTGDEEKDRSILRYEIYLRYYAINLWRIGSPYSFTAIGSAIALPVKSYKKIGGITPHKSGEDFYFLQKLRKTGKVLTWNKEKVYPAARYSDRVAFGTGPAMIKGREGDWSGYPIYPFEYFDEIKKTYDLFPVLYKEDFHTPMDNFIIEKFGEKNILQPLRKNYKKKETFIRACHYKIDGFRIFQYLKWRNMKNKGNWDSDENNLIRFFTKFYPEKLNILPFEVSELSIASTSVENLNTVRKLLLKIEKEYQKGK
ncbi:MAG: hypothetical protein H8D45_07185 [Bacteroidetes bacterium]|nr:hypothetical protein [Bacteroidota bacterium]MBL7103057.1 hypothetical protein [Bacteroidales bacterium]